MIKKIGHFSPQILELLTAESDALGEKSYGPQDALTSYATIKDVLNSMDTHERQQLLQRCMNCMHKITSDKAETDQTQAVLMLRDKPTIAAMKNVAKILSTEIAVPAAMKASLNEVRPDIEKFWGTITPSDISEIEWGEILQVVNATDAPHLKHHSGLLELLKDFDKAMDKKSANGKVNLVKVGEAMSKVKESCDSFCTSEGPVHAFACRAKEYILAYDTIVGEIIFDTLNGHLKELQLAADQARQVCCGGPHGKHWFSEALDKDPEANIVEVYQKTIGGNPKITEQMNKLSAKVQNAEHATKSFITSVQAAFGSGEQLNPEKLAPQCTTILSDAKTILQSTEVTRLHGLMCQVLLRATEKNAAKTKARCESFTAELSALVGKDWRQGTPDDLVIQLDAAMA